MAFRSTSIRVAIAAALAAYVNLLAAAPARISLTEVLEALRATGVDVLYSSDLVRPGLQVDAPLHGADAKARAIEALAFFGLQLQSTADGRLLVVRAPSAARIPATPPEVPPVYVSQGPIEEVSVYASRFVLGERPVIGPNSLTHADIEQVPGSESDALRATRALPGLATNVSSRPYIRGSRLEDVLVEFDGVPLADPFHLKNFQSLISAFDSATVDKIEVYSSGFPVRYGTRSGGVIDIAPRSLPSGSEHRLGASLLAYDASSVGRAERWPVDWLVSARHSAPDIAIKPVSGDIGNPQFADTIGRVRWRQSAATAWTVGWLLLDDRVKLSTDPADEVASARYRDEYGWLAYDRRFGDGLQSRTVVVLTSAERSRAGDLAIAGVASGHADEERSFSNVQLLSEWRYQESPRASWDFGIEASSASAELAYVRSVSYSNVIAAGFDRAPEDVLTAGNALRSASYAVFGSARRSWSGLVAEIGARFDGQSYRGFRSDTQLSPRFNLRYDFAAAWRLYGSWGQFDQAQRIDEWRVEEAQARPDAAEHAVHAVVGLAFEGVSTRWRLEIYRKHWSQVQPYFDNLLDSQSLIPDLEPDRVRVTPEGAESAGLELSVRRSLAPSLELWGTYAWARVVDELADSDVPRSWDQPHALSVGLAWTGTNATASVLAGWHRGWPRTPFAVTYDTAGLPSALAIGARNSGRWGDYFTLDLRATRTQRFARGDLVLSVDLTNATDRRNTCCVTFTPAADAKYWLPRTIDVGASWRFGRRPEGSRR